MIHEIGVNLGQYFKAAGCPIPVVDGPEFRPTTTFARERVVIEHNPTGDIFAPRRRADVNPRTRLTREIGVKITIYAQQPSKGAIYFEHVRRAEHVLDIVLIGIDKIAKERKNFVDFSSGKFVYTEDMTKSETPGGAVYELLLTFDRGVVDRSWDGAADPTATISAVYPGTGSGVIIRNTDNVSGSTEDGGPSTEGL